mgnify:CR=1 FL=1
MKINNAKTNWVYLGLLLGLCLVPLLAGFHRLWLIGLQSSEADNRRFLLSPLPVIVHIISMAIYAPLGATQVVPYLRQRWQRFHRKIGVILVITGVLVGVSGLWMTQMYPRVGHDGLAVYIFRWIAGMGILYTLTKSLFQLYRKKYQSHGDWMIRSYAIAMAAGTQVFTHIPLLVFPDLQGETGRAIAMGSAWCLNLAFAEWIIKNNKRSII